MLAPNHHQSGVHSTLAGWRRCPPRQFPEPSIAGQASSHTLLCLPPSFRYQDIQQAQEELAASALEAMTEAKRAFTSIRQATADMAKNLSQWKAPELVGSKYSASW